MHREMTDEIKTERNKQNQNMRWRNKYGGYSFTLYEIVAKMLSV
jgi:hypothetical protein